MVFELIRTICLIDYAECVLLTRCVIIKMDVFQVLHFDLNGSDLFDYFVADTEVTVDGNPPHFRFFHDSGIFFTKFLSIFLVLEPDLVIKYHYELSL